MPLYPSMFFTPVQKRQGFCFCKLDTCLGGEHETFI